MAVTTRVLSWLLVITGATAITIGAAIVTPALGWIVGGLLALVVGLVVVDVDSPLKIEVHR